MYLSALSFSGD